jgi:Glycosyl transferase 4-like
MEVRNKKLILVIADDWYFWSHRLPLARAAQQNGFDVVIATRVTNLAQKIRDEGFRLVPLHLSRGSYSPFNEFRTILQLRRLYRAERPDIVHHVALKPILYGSIAALGMKQIQVINALAGLGYLVASSSLKARLLRLPIWNAFKLLLNQPRTRVLRALEFSIVVPNPKNRCECFAANQFSSAARIQPFRPEVS